MDQQSEKQRLRISISPTKMTSKKYKETKLTEIDAGVCALMNCRGGTLDVFLEADNSNTKCDVGEFVRMIEQRVAKMVEVTEMVSHIKIQANNKGITMDIKESPRLITLNYNLYLPTVSEVKAVQATTAKKEIEEILHRTIVEDCVPHGSHKKLFVMDTDSKLRESYDVQLKELEACPSKCITFADRMVGKSNKFSQYISAFANHRGGNIYYGINDSGIVKGETISEKEKNKVVKKVTQAIGKMVWGQERSTPNKKRQWDIFFEEVVDADRNPVKDTFVIVIFVASYLGGVFTEEPESFYITESDCKVKRMNFIAWWHRFTGQFPRNTTVVPIAQQVRRLTWSSEENRTLFIKLSEKLVDHRDAGDIDGFNKLCGLATQHFPNNNAEMVTKAGQITIAYKSHDFSRARTLVGEFEGLLNSSEDKSIFKVRMLLSKLLVERSAKEYEVSNEIVQNALQLIDLIPVGLCTLWLYLEAAMNQTCNAFMNQNDLGEHLLKKRSALDYLELAARAASSLEDQRLPFRIDDFQHKLCIYKAWTYLNCSITGQVAQKIAPSQEDIEAATKELASVSKYRLKGRQLTHYRQVQFHLVECDLFRRRSELLQEDCVSNLKEALECGKKARDLANKPHFTNMLDYANKRIADIREKLAHYTASMDESPVKRTFFGLEY